MAHEDLSDLLPDIEAVEKLINSEAQDDNGRGAGSIVAVLRDPTGIVLLHLSINAFQDDS